MSTTVTYKGSTLATLANQTKTLDTAGTWLEDDITITDSSSSVSLQSKTVSYTPSTSSQSSTITADSGYDGLSSVSVSVAAMPIGSAASGNAAYTKEDDLMVVWFTFPNFTPGYISSLGPFASGQDLENKTVTPTESSQTVTPTSDYHYLESVTVNAISPTYVGSGITQRSSSDLTASGATVTAPAGYYASAASASVASGTAGTPTATKGTVSNHSITVTPSVTNTTGYITGSTKTGTAVTVSASELVSGSETKTANGTYDVTNLASLVVAVPFATIYSGSSTPSSSTGSNGDIYIQTS